MSQMFELKLAFPLILFPVVTDRDSPSQVLVLLCVLLPALVAPAVHDILRIPGLQHTVISRQQQQYKMVQQPTDFILHQDKKYKLCPVVLFTYSEISQEILSQKMLCV